MSELDQYAEIETGEAFTLQNPRLLKIELSATNVMARNGSMVAYQGDVRFEHKGGGLGRLLKKAATGEGLRLMEATGTGELFLASEANLVHVLRLDGDVREYTVHCHLLGLVLSRICLPLAQCNHAALLCGWPFVLQ